MPKVIIPTDTIFGVKIEGATERYFKKLEEKERAEAEAERKNSIVIPNENLQFITDKKLYDEIIKILHKNFPE